jgi:hypothetical protein
MASAKGGPRPAERPGLFGAASRGPGSTVGLTPNKVLVLVDKKVGAVSHVNVFWWVQISIPSVPVCSLFVRCVLVQYCTIVLTGRRRLPACSAGVKTRSRLRSKAETFFKQPRNGPIGRMVCLQRTAEETAAKLFLSQGTGVHCGINQ